MDEKLYRKKSKRKSKDRRERKDSDA